jgi:hypothetical protein
MTDENATPKKRVLADEWRPKFLASLRNSGNVRAACLAAGIDRRTAYRNRDNSTEFAAQWDEALQDAIDALEAVAINRARTSSDTLLIFLLKAHRPEKYRETVRNEHSGPNGEPLFKIYERTDDFDPDSA